VTFQVVWGFDPDKALRAQDLFRRTLVPLGGSSEDETDTGGGQENVRMPPGKTFQVYELRRLFRL